MSDETPEWKVPAKLHDVANAALVAGRSYLVSHGEDTGGNPFVNITVKWPDHEIRATWHTRSTRQRPALPHECRPRYPAR